ncbi:MAG: hypothetical protein DRP42_07045 [Tenericutes bacterium]|nr:MAG: hypothetical protein DRP42_07045 [Mycoplasmatota bacterium]
MARSQKDKWTRARKKKYRGRSPDGYETKPEEVNLSGAMAWATMTLPKGFIISIALANDKAASALIGKDNEVIEVGSPDLPLAESINALVVKAMEIGK